MASRADALRHVEIFERDWNAVQRSAPFARCEFLFRLARLGTRELGGDSDEAMQLAVERFDAFKAGFGEIHR